MPTRLALPTTRIPAASRGQFSTGFVEVVREPDNRTRLRFFAHQRAAWPVLELADTNDVIWGWLENLLEETTKALEGPSCTSS